MKPTTILALALSLTPVAVPAFAAPNKCAAVFSDRDAAAALTSLQIVDTKSDGRSHKWNENLNRILDNAARLNLQVDSLGTGVRITQPDSRGDFAALAGELRSHVSSLSAPRGQKYSVEVVSDTEIRIHAPRSGNGVLWTSSIDGIISSAIDGKRMKVDYRVTDDGATLRLHFLHGALDVIATQIATEVQGTQWRLIAR